MGNDFLPPLPTLDIAEGALNSLFEIYKEELPTMGGYITYEGAFDAARLERILTRLAALEESVLAQRCVPRARARSRTRLMRVPPGSARDAADVAEKKERREEREAKRNGASRRTPVELDDEDAFDAVRPQRRASRTPPRADAREARRSWPRLARWSRRLRPTRP